MAIDDRIEVVKPKGLREADPTPGMRREQAIAVEGLWAGRVRTQAHAISGWHHHGAHETAIYVVRGSLRLEFGAQGADVADASPGDFLHVPGWVVHRESNPADEESEIVVVRSGSGPPTINVAGPAGTKLGM